MDDIVIAVLRSATPLVYVTLAGVIAQRAGIWHLGLEGLMIAGACGTILGIVLTNSLVLALLIAIAICVLGSVLFWFVIEILKANQIIAWLPNMDSTASVVPPRPRPVRPNPAMI